MLAFVNSCARPDGPADRFDLMIAANSPEPLAYLRTNLDIDWDRIPE